MTNFIGKPYAGKLHVRFDEGVGKVFYPSRSTLLKPVIEVRVIKFDLTYPKIPQFTLTGNLGHIYIIAFYVGIVSV
jgi:hypothetical protein